MLGTARRPPVRGVEKLATAIARNFKGGLNTYDPPLNLNSQYIIEGKNVYPDTNGTLRVRFGTTQFSDLAAIASDVVAMEYYINVLVCVFRNGKVATVNSAGVATIRWNAGWTNPTNFASFAQFGGNLIICNGVDKPLIMNSALVCNYLVDPGSLTNVNTPRAKYCVTHNNYLILAVTPTESTKLYISAKGTSGTFAGDPPPNDAVTFDTSTYLTRGVAEITGLGSFRDKLIVTYGENIIPITLGAYNGTAHVPNVDDIVDTYGAISHRCIVPMGDDILFLDKVGIASVTRALISAAMSPTRESLLVGRDMQKAMTKFTAAQLSDNLFAINDRIASQVLFFIPKDTTVTSTTDNDVYVFCIDKTQRFRAMALFSEMPYRCGARSSDGRIFLAAGTKVWYYRNQYEPVYVDNGVPGQQPWSDNTNWDDGTGWTGSGASATYTGTPIAFTIGTPWSDHKEPERQKDSRYLHVLMEGEGIVNVEMYTDRFAPVQLSMQFTQTEFPAANSAVLRPLNNDQLYAWNAKYTRARLRLHGTTVAALSLISVGVLYLQGGYRR